MSTTIRQLHWLTLCLMIAIVTSVSLTQTAFATGKGRHSEAAWHDYTYRFSAGLWFSRVYGAYVAKQVTGGLLSDDDIKVKVDDDLGYDNTYTSADISAAYRTGKHDFWIVGRHFSQDERRRIDFSFEVDGEVFEAGNSIATDITITDVDLRYGYSFYTFEEDGFRLGPVVALSYTNFEFELVDVEILNTPIPVRWKFSQAAPVPTIGVRYEVPYRQFLFVAQAGGLYFDFDELSGKGLRAELTATWRPWRHVGFYAGLSAMYVDLSLRDEDIDDFTLFGPSVGVEVRF